MLFSIFHKTETEFEIAEHGSIPSMPANQSLLRREYLTVQASGHQHRTSE